MGSKARNALGRLAAAGARGSAPPWQQRLCFQHGVVASWAGVRLRLVERGGSRARRPVAEDRSRARGPHPRLQRREVPWGRHCFHWQRRQDCPGVGLAVRGADLAPRCGGRRRCRGDRQRNGGRLLGGRTRCCFGSWPVTAAGGGREDLPRALRPSVPWAFGAGVGEELRTALRGAAAHVGVRRDGAPMGHRGVCCVAVHSHGRPVDVGGPRDVPPARFRGAAHGERGVCAPGPSPHRCPPRLGGRRP
mmetsp:Transcript_12693/g.48669  ORF Transcript_12693/g.48669 Transcript_12693/m.48669 type:complete len:248 (+) Transcript_12693:273-1016(+)